MISSVVFFIPSGISQSLFSEGSHFEDKLQQNVKRSLKFTFCFVGPAIIALVLVGKWLLLAFGASYSANSFSLLIILAVSGIPIGLNHIYISCLRVLKRLKELVAVSLFIALTVLVGSYFLMPAIGIMGIGYTWLGAQSIVALYIILGRRLEMKAYVKEE
jgi:O-antigen/teichoic acid export membrane protein